jgi:hypothetical protein
MWFQEFWQILQGGVASIINFTFCALEVILWNPRLGWKNYEWLHWIPIRIGSNLFLKKMIMLVICICVHLLIIHIYGCLTCFLSKVHLVCVSLIIPCSLQVLSVLRIKIYMYIFKFICTQPSIMCSGKFDYHVLEVFHVYFWLPKKGWEGCGHAFLFRLEGL